MSDTYNPRQIEQKWQAKWDASGLYRSEVDWDKPKHYALTMLPYPSGDLHIGHWFAMTPSDARARYMRMKGYNVLFPMGFDAFGLPAEQAAISRNIHPWKWTYNNIERMRDQLKSMGAMFDWEREAITCTPPYYTWTEWFFKTFYENDLAYRSEAMVNWSDALQTVLANEQVIDGKDERLGQPVIQKMMTQWFFRIKQYADELLDFDGLDWPEPVKIMQTNWIGRSEGAQVTFKADGTGDAITVFTTRPDTLWGATFMVLAPEHRLVDALTSDDQREAVAAYQTQAAQATEIERLSDDREKTGVFTGGYAINPVNQERIPVWIADYVMASYGTGAIMAVPAHDARDFAFARKYDLTITPVIQPDDSDDTPTGESMTESYVGPGTMINSGPINGIEHNGAKGRKSPAIAAAIDYVEAEGIGSEDVNYRLRDWLISRQRYWGSPIPMVYPDGAEEPVPVRDDDLPVELPEDVEFKPTGQSPLTYHEPFLHTEMPDGTAAKRETDTMDTFMCSSWYQYRYLSPGYGDYPFDPEEAAYWLPVDTYTGGAEHATMHLLYTRFFTKAMRDTGVFDPVIEVMEAHGRDPDAVINEPMTQLRNQGQVLGAERPGDYVLVTGQRDGIKVIADRVEVINPNQNAIPTPENGVAVVHGELMKRTENTLFIGDSKQMVEVPEGVSIRIPGIQGENDVNQLKHHLDIQRMSKSKGNVINPDDLVAQYGSDTVRAYLMFGFDWEKGGPWDEGQITGPRGWVDDVWKIVTNGISGDTVDAEAERDIERAAHQAIQKIDYNMQNFKFNVVVATLMALRNDMKDAIKRGISQERFEEAVSIMLRLAAPVVPHITEELWSRMGWEYSIHAQPFPAYDAEKAKEDTVELVVMVNGKPRENIDVAPDISEDDAKAAALASEAAKRFMDGKEAKRVIFIPGGGNREPKVNIVV